MINLSADEKTLVLIDGHSVRQTLKSLSIELDYKRLLHHFRKHSRLTRAVYCTLLSQDEGVVPRALIDWLDYNGFTIVSRTAKPVYDENSVPHLRGDARVELAVAAMELSTEVDHIVLFSSHGSLACLVAALKRRGVRVTVVSSLAARPGGVAEELRRAADSFVELLELDMFFLDRARPERGASEPPSDGGGDPVVAGSPVVRDEIDDIAAGHTPDAVEQAASSASTTASAPSNPAPAAPCSKNLPAEAPQTLPKRRTSAPVEPLGEPPIAAAAGTTVEKRRTTRLPRASKAAAKAAAPDASPDTAGD